MEYKALVSFFHNNIKISKYQIISKEKFGFSDNDINFLLSKMILIKYDNKEDIKQEIIKHVENKNEIEAVKEIEPLNNDKISTEIDKDISLDNVKNVKEKTNKKTTKKTTKKIKED